MATFTPAEITDLDAFKIGNAQNTEAATGCTVILSLDGAVCGVDVRGGGPATRETDLLKPENMVEAIHAVVLSGGSAFGLAASTGVMEELEAHNIGFELLGMHVPIVCGACLFDLPVGISTIRPDAAMGKAAVQAALAEEPLEQGNIGAGTGCSVSKLRGMEHAWKSGLGYAAYRFEDVIVGAVVAVNACGNINDRSGATIAGPADTDHGLENGIESFKRSVEEQMAQDQTAPCTNTTIGCIITNARITKAQAQKVASTTHDAYARCISPVHTSNDGDTIFCMSSAQVEAPYDLVAVMATEAMQDAIINGVTNAKPAYGLPGLGK